MAGDRLFRALARPQMVAGVTYPFFVLNGIVALGYAAHLRDPHIMALWMTRLRRVPRVPNRSLWGANVYRP